jgi:hypothetical protein
MCIWTNPWRKREDEDYFGPVINLFFEDVKLDKKCALEYYFLQRSEAIFTSERHINISGKMDDDTIKSF